MKGWIIGGMTGGLLLVAAGGLRLFWKDDLKSTRSNVATPQPHLRPTLYCDFYNFMHNATIASFYFAVDPGQGSEGPKYSELYVVENEGEKTEFGGPDQPPSPQWTFAIDDGTPTIASPDGATRIVLYGLKPKAGGVFWVEAGVRSNTYRNLEGKCRQAHYVTTTSSTKP